MFYGLDEASLVDKLYAQLILLFWDIFNTGMRNSNVNKQKFGSPCETKL